MSASSDVAADAVNFTNRPWTRDELVEFVELYPTTPTDELMKRFDRTYRGIISKAYALQVTKSLGFRTKQGRLAHEQKVGPRRPRIRREWSREAKQSLLNEYPHTSNAELAARYGVSVRAVACVANLAGVTKSREYAAEVGRRNMAQAQVRIAQVRAARLAAKELL